MRNIHLGCVLLLIAIGVIGCGTVGKLGNRPPIVHGFMGPDMAVFEQKYPLSVSASDPDGDSLTYEWVTSAGVLDKSSGSQVMWTAPAIGAVVTVTVHVSDGPLRTTVSKNIVLTGLVRENRAPVISDLNLSKWVHVGLSVAPKVEATDPDGDILFYQWSATAGTLDYDTSPTAKWQAPHEESEAVITVEVSDGILTTSAAGTINVIQGDVVFTDSKRGPSKDIFSYSITNTSPRVIRELRISAEGCSLAGVISDIAPGENRSAKVSIPNCMPLDNLILSINSVRYDDGTGWTRALRSVKGRWNSAEYVQDLYELWTETEGWRGMALIATEGSQNR